MQRISHWIDGKVVDGTSGRSGVVWNPATGEQQAAVDLASAAEVVARSSPSPRRRSRHGAPPTCRGAPR